MRQRSENRARKSAAGLTPVGQQRAKLLDLRIGWLHALRVELDRADALQALGAHAEPPDPRDIALVLHQGVVE